MKTTKNVMHKKVITIGPDQTLLEAYKVMREKDIRHLPVLSPTGTLVGILSDRDIQRAMMSRKISEFQQEIHLADDLKVSDFMNWPVYTVAERTPIDQVAEVMLKQKVSALVVENDFGKVSGIVTTNDLLAYLVDMIHQPETIQVYPLSFYR